MTKSKLTSLSVTPTVACLCFVFSSLPLPVAAQSVEACLTAKGNQAIETCSQALDNGSREENIYFKLASELYQQSDASRAAILIEDGLEIYPNSINLSRLKSYVELDKIEEQEREKEREASANNNSAELKLDKLKTTCRSKNSTQGISACREYLSKTQVDKALIEERLGFLESESTLAVNEPVSEPTSEPAPTTTKPFIVETPQLTQDESDTIGQAAAALRVLVFDVQTNLRRLGFNTGAPDGIPGNLTRKALISFYEKNAVPKNEFSENGFISNDTLRDLINANSDKQAAERSFLESKKATNAGNAALALLKLNQAEQTSAFFTVPAGYKGKLRAEVLAQQKANAAGSQVGNTPENSTPDATPGVTTPGLKDITALLDRIKQFELKLLIQEKSLQESVQAIDETTADIKF